MSQAQYDVHTPLDALSSFLCDIKIHIFRNENSWVFRTFLFFFVYMHDTLFSRRI